MRRLIKRVGRNMAIRGFLCWAASLYVRLTYATTRWQVRENDQIVALLAANRPIIPAFWHSRLLMSPMRWRHDRRLRVLISTHRDGELIARTVGHLGIGTVRGSTTRGGVAALREMVMALKVGDSVGITPDGPRGPRMRVHPGIIALASLSGVPLAPVTYSASHCRFLNSWDRFVLALPFGRGVFLWGMPITVARDADAAAREAARLELERQLNALTAEADRMMGHVPIEPDPDVMIEAGA